MKEQGWRPRWPANSFYGRPLGNTSKHVVWILWWIRHQMVLQFLAVERRNWRVANRVLGSRFNQCLLHWRLYLHISWQSAPGPPHCCNSCSYSSWKGRRFCQIWARNDSVISTVYQANFWSIQTREIHHRIFCSGSHLLQWSFVSLRGASCGQTPLGSHRWDSDCYLSTYYLGLGLQCGEWETGPKNSR